MEKYKVIERSKDTGSTHSLLGKGMVPGIVYGKGTEPKNKLIGIKNQLIKILTLSKEKNQLTTVSSNELAEAGFQ